MRSTTKLLLVALVLLLAAQFIFHFYAFGIKTDHATRTLTRQDRLDKLKESSAQAIDDLKIASKALETALKQQSQRSQNVKPTHPRRLMATLRPTPTITEPPTPYTVTTYAQAHDGWLPVLILCYNRAKELGKTLDELIKLDGFDSRSILVLQDGSEESVRAEITKRKLSIIQDTRTENMKQGGSRIALHYKFALEEAFAHFPDTPAIVILEDDLRVSPDFMNWFVASGILVESDPTLWCSSAWNDNGFTDVISTGDSAKYAVRRTNLFPGLGWLLFRDKFNVLKSTWPDDQWDWFVRRTYQKSNQECIHPEIPRTFHAGREGTFVTESDQRLIFDRMAHNEDRTVDWLHSSAGQESLINAKIEAYDQRITNAIRSAVHVANAETFEQVVADQSSDGRAFVLWYEIDPDPRQEGRVLEFAKYFGIWHQLLRGSHEAMHEITFRGRKLFLINVFFPRAVFSLWFTSYSHQTSYYLLKPPTATVFAPETFMQQVKMKMKDVLMMTTTTTEEQRIVVEEVVDGQPEAGVADVSDVAAVITPNALFSVVPSKRYGDSCAQVCHQAGKECEPRYFSKLNLCTTLQRYFRCNGCFSSAGADQPCYVSPSAQSKQNPTSCLTSSESVFSCDGKFALTKRLCPCV